MGANAFQAAQDAYETWLRAALPGLIVEDDLASKHDAIRESAFAFLRGTCWRWAETSAELCPAFTDAPVVGSVGDAHLENFGLWRDSEARLVWGVNDFDEAALTPYACDLIRLGASVLLASDGEAILVRALIDGYRDRLEKPRPYILEDKYAKLRERFTTSEDERAEYWKKLFKLKDAPAPPMIDGALREAIPDGASEIRIAPRFGAGVGSRGRMRFVAMGLLQGSRFAREAKALAPSCWTRVGHEGLNPVTLANSRYRATDPHLAVDGPIILRRLAPNSRKLETDGQYRLDAWLIEFMGGELANIHAADERAIPAIAADLGQRRASDFIKAAKTVAEATTREWKSYR